MTKKLAVAFLMGLLTGGRAFAAIPPGKDLGRTWSYCTSPGSSGDADNDGINQDCESAFSSAFAPLLWFDTGETTGTRNSHWAVGKGKGKPDLVRVLYAFSYYRDGGWTGGIGAHDGDSEFVVVSLDNDPAGSTVWKVNQVFLSAHTGAPPCDASGWKVAGAFAYTGDGRPIIYVSRNKHANYTSAGSCGSQVPGICPEACSQGSAAYPDTTATKNLGSEWAQLINQVTIGSAYEWYWTRGGVAQKFCGWQRAGDPVNRDGCSTDYNKWLHGYLTSFTSPAEYDATLKALRCGALGSVGSVCDSAMLLDGRDSISGGLEPNQPTTINGSCTDGTLGAYHSDESIDWISVSTTDGKDFAPQKTVQVEVRVWAWSGYTDDHLDLYYTADAKAASPVWTYITTLTPTVAGPQTLSATYTLPYPTGLDRLEAVRANFRYLGSPSSCGTGSYDDHDDLVFAVGGGTATYNGFLGAPACNWDNLCDSLKLLDGRDGLGPEPNQPNTLVRDYPARCVDGTLGTYHNDESVDRIKVYTTDRTPFKAGKTLRVDVTVWAWAGYTDDHLDLYYAANAGTSPLWTYLTTLTPAGSGLQTLSWTYTLPAPGDGTSWESVRARFRYQGSQGSNTNYCTSTSNSNHYDDHDDLVFTVSP